MIDLIQITRSNSVKRKKRWKREKKKKKKKISNFNENL